MPLQTIQRAFPPIASALKETLAAGYTRSDLRHDLLAGLSVGIIAVPLSLALAIASGVAPQHGLYTAVVAGALIALTGGSRYNVSGPTAAFVVIATGVALANLWQRARSPNQSLPGKVPLAVARGN